MSKHTPGPWRWYLTDGGAVVGPGNGTWGIENISESDARLIAAAPELLAALRVMVNYAGLAFPQDALTGAANDARALIERIDGPRPAKDSPLSNADARLIAAAPDMRAILENSARVASSARCLVDDDIVKLRNALFAIEASCRTLLDRIDND